MSRSLALLWLCACAAKPHHYTLHVDLTNQENSVLCQHDVEEKISVPKAGTSAPADMKCPRFGNRALSTPATLTIKLENGAKGGKYDLRIEQSSREASKADVTALLTRFADNAGRLVRVTAPTKDPGEKGDIVNKTLKKAAEVVSDRAPAAAAKLLTRSNSEDTANEDAADDNGDEDGEEETREPKQKFKGSIDEQAKVFKSATTIRTGVQLSSVNEPLENTPPPRDFQLTQADLDYLKQTYSLNTDKVMDFVIDWCSAESFMPDDTKARFAELVATEPRIADVAELLKLSKTELAQLLIGKGDMSMIETKRQALIDEAGQWDKASKAAKAYWFMRIGNNLDFALNNCNENVDFLLEKATGAKKTQLERTKQGIHTLTAAADKWSKSFLGLFAPFFREAVNVLKQEIDLTEGDISATLSLEPGELEFGVGQLDADGKRQELATFKSHIKGVERLAIVLGPTATVCWWGCFDTIEEVVEQPADPMMGGKRTLQKNRARYDLALATALHLTMIRADDWGFGPLLGYPLGATDDTSTNVLLGFAARHGSGFEVAVGAHGMRARELKNGYGPSIDLEVDGNQGLTVESVTTERVRVGVFVLIAFAPGLAN